MIRRLAAVVGATAVAVLAFAAPAAAHPLGNFTTNQYAGLRIGVDAVDVDYVLDLAELPAFQARRDDVDRDRTGGVTDAEGDAYADRTCAEVARLTTVTVDGRPEPVVARAATFDEQPGTGGLATIRVECWLRAAATIRAESTVDYRNAAFAGRTGWHEVTALGDRMTLVRSTVPADTVSTRLAVYPPDLAPPDVRTATLVVRPGGPAAARAPGVVATDDRADLMTAWFGDLVGRPQLGVGIGLLALLLAMVLGAAHAVAPGHGKTVMAAYLVTQRGHRRQAVAMAAMVAATHTLGVLVLAVAIATSLEIAPEAAYGWLKLASGALVAVLGVFLLRRALRSGHQHHHHHHGHVHEHGPMPSRTAVFMGFVGGLSPSPSAVVVLLGAAALGRAWLGALLVIAYGIGMAATLTGFGLALARWGTWIQARLSERWATLAARRLPTAAATAILLVGLGVMAVALVDLGHRPG